MGPSESEWEDLKKLMENEEFLLNYLKPSKNVWEKFKVNFKSRM